MKEIQYNWAVIVDNKKIVGYVKSSSELYAIKIAQEKITKNNFSLEKVVLGNLVPENEEYIIREYELS